VLKAIDTLVIDEVSMVNADLMDAIDRSLRQARGRRSEPFGGVQIIMFGDPYQLSPVPPRGDELRYIQDHYRSFWFFDAQVWAGPRRTARRSAPTGCSISAASGRPAHPRTAPDPPPGRRRVQGDAQRRAPRGRDRRDRGHAERRGRPPGARAGRGRASDHHARDPQRHRVAHQPAPPRRPAGPVQTARADVSGDFGRGEASYPADTELQLKVGAQVMFLRNDVGGRGDGPRWVNGSIGTVTRIAGGTVRVELDGEEVDVEPAVWERFRYAYDPARESSPARSSRSSRSSRCDWPGR
jgi:hypothetical protein